MTQLYKLPSGRFDVCASPPPGSRPVRRIRIVKEVASASGPGICYFSPLQVVEVGHEPGDVPPADALAWLSHASFAPSAEVVE